MNRLLALRWLRDHIGRRGTALLFFALLDAIYAYSLYNPAPEVRRTGLVQFVEAVAPLWVWGSLWALAGVFCLVYAFRRSDQRGFAAAIAIKVLWGVLCLLAMFNGVDRAYVSAAIWLAAAGWVGVVATWPEYESEARWTRPR